MLTLFLAIFGVTEIRSTAMNCILGIMAKVAPQMNMFAVGIQIKIFFGYAILVVTVILLPRAAAMIGDEVKLMLRMVVKGMYGTG